MLSRLQEHKAEVRFFVQGFAQANPDNEERATRNKERMMRGYRSEAVSVKSISRQGVGLAGLRALAVVALCLAAALWAAPAFAADGTWLGTTGNWSATGTWSGGTIADGPDFTAFFTGVDITADQTITLDTARIIGNITFTDDTTSSNNLTISGANTLLLDVTTGSPTIDVTQSGRTLTIDSLIGGSDGLTKSGAGTLILSGANNYIGTTTISAGELVATTGATFTPFGTSTVDIGANILTLSPSSTAANSTLTNTLTGTGTLNINPAAGRNMTLSGTLSGFTGTVNVASNTGVAKAATGAVTLGSGAIVNIASGATWFMTGGTHSGITANIYGTGNSENLGALRMDGGTIASNSSVVLKANGSVGGNSGTGTINAVISDGGGGFSLTKMGAATTVLGAANTYTGATIINKGTLSLANVSALANTSAITIAGGAMMDASVSGISSSAPITLGNSGTTSTIQLSLAATSSLTLGAISGAGNLVLQNSGGGNPNPASFTLNGASTYSGNTLLDSTTTNASVMLKLGVNNALPTTTVLTIDGGAGAGSGRTISLNLNGKNQTLAGLTSVITGTLRTNRVYSSSAATLTIDGSTNTTYAGLIGNGGTAVSVVKSGSGTWTISGANTYTGTTKINAGTLVISGSPTGNSAMFVNGGTLTLDYSTNNTSKINDLAVLTLGGGTVNLSGGTHTEVVASTTLTAGTASSVTSSTPGSVLQMNTIERGAGATINFGASGIATTDTLNTNGVLGAWAMMAGGTDFAANSTNGADGPITAPTYTDVQRLTPGTIANGSATNVRLVEGSGPAGSILLGAATTTINTLNQSASGGPSAATIDPAGQTLLTNAILLGTGAGSLTIGAGTNNGTLTTATAGGELTLINNTANGITINSDIADNTMASTLTKMGAGTATLTGANTYTGGTTVSAGRLQFAKQASLYNNTPAGWTAANINVKSGATLALNVDSAGAAGFTSASLSTLLGNISVANTAAEGLQAGAILGFDTSTATAGAFTQGNAIANSTGASGGAISVIKLGAGTLVLDKANTYTGTTTIDEGTLAFTTTDPSLTGGLTFGVSNGSTITGALDLSDASATFGGAFLVRTNSATANTISIGAAKTLTLSGGLTLGYDAAGGTGQTDSKLTVSGDGSMAVNGTTINISVNQAATNAGYWSKGTLDVSALAAFSTNVTNFNIGVGNNSQGPGDVILSDTANTILATTLTVGNTGANNGRGTSTLTLGTGTNVIQADTIYIGRNKSSGPGVVKFASQTAGSPGTVTISDKAGTGRANLDIANQLANTTGGGAVGTLDLRGHVATVSAGTVTIGAVAASSGAGGPNGTLSFDAGTFDVNTLNLAPKSAAGTGTARATVNIGGGTFTVNTAFTLGSQAGSGASVATLNLTGGTLNSAASILDGGGSTTSKITLDGGTLNMNGNAIGGAVAIDTLEFQSGTLQNVAQINNGATALTKTTTGTLVLTGTNAYTGGTTVNAGTLLLSGAFNMPTTGTLQVNAGGNFSLADGTASSTTTTAALGLASGALLTFDWNAGSVDMLTSTAAATTAGTVGININNTSPSGSGGTLISSASGGLTTANGTQYFLANNTNYTATLTVTDTAVSIGEQSAATALTDAYWKGGQLTGGALGAMALSSGTSSNWATDAAGTSANGVVPGGSAVNVIFGAAGATEQANVTTGADMNLGSITFNDSTAVTIGGSHVITLNSTSAAAATSSGSGTTVTPGSAITVTSSANAANAINANIRLAAGQTWNIASGKTLTVGGSVGGAGALTLADAGTLILTGANAYTGATAVSAGTMQLGDGTTGKDGTIGNTSGVTNNAALVFNRFGSSSAGYAISGTGTVTKLGAGAQALSGTNTYTGATTISAGTLQFAKEVSLYNNNTAGTGWTAANIVVGNGGTLALNVGGTDEFTTTDVTTLLTNLGGANGTSTAGYAAGSKIAFDTTNASGGTFTVGDLIADSSGSGGGAIGLTKLGTNALTLTNANTYSGVTTISAGTLALNVNTATLGTTAVGTVVASGAALKLQASMTLNEALTLSGSGVGTAANTFGALLLNYNTGAFTLAGAITLDGGAAINTYLAGTADIQIAQGIGGTGDLTLRASAANNGGALYRLQGASTYDGNTILSTNATNQAGITVQNEIDNALPTTTVLKLQATSGSPSTQGKYKLNGYNQTVTGIEGSVGATTLNSIVGGSATLSTLTVNNSGNYTFDGQLGNTGTNENNLALVKSGVGTLTLTAANTYTGDTKVEAGTLSITSAYLANLADVYLTTGARFDLDFTGTDTIDELFFNGTGQLAGIWGSIGSTAFNQSNFFTGDGLLLVTTSGVVPGDTNEDRVVDAADFITLKKNFGRTNAADAQNGNFTTGDTNVNWADLGILMNNMGTGGPAPATAPEPATLGLLAIGALAVIRRRRA